MGENHARKLLGEAEGETKGSGIISQIISSIDKDTDYSANVQADAPINEQDKVTSSKGTYINKKKVLDYLHLSAPIAETSNSQELSSATKIMKEFESPQINREENIRYRDRSVNNRSAYVNDKSETMCEEWERIMLANYLARQRKSRLKRKGLKP